MRRINSDPSKFEKINFSKFAFKKFGLRMQHFRRQIWEIRGVLKRSRRDLSIGDIFFLKKIAKNVFFLQHIFVFFVEKILNNFLRNIEEKNP